MLVVVSVTEEEVEESSVVSAATDVPVSIILSNSSVTEAVTPPSVAPSDTDGRGPRVEADEALIASEEGLAVDEPSGLTSCPAVNVEVVTAPISNGGR